MNGSKKRGQPSLFATICALLICMSTLLSAAETVQKNILVLYSDNRLLPGAARFDEEFQRLLREIHGTSTAVYNEFLDVERFANSNYGDQVAQFLKQKYADKKINVIVAARAPALNFVLDHRDELLSTVPIVHAAVTNAELKVRTIPADVVGVPIVYEPEVTMQLALKLHPKTRRIVFITGLSAHDKFWESLFHDAAAKLENRASAEYWSGLPLSELEERARALQADSVIYTLGIQTDRTGQTYVPRETVKRLAEVSSVPVYVTYNTLVGTGAIGGYVPSMEDLASAACKAVEQVLAGKRGPEISLAASIQNTNILDWRQLRRFGVPESSLPKNSVVLFRQPTFWESYFWYVIGGIALLILETGLLLAIFVHRRIRKRIESRLQESERAMGLVAHAVNLGVWSWDLQLDTIWATDRAKSLVNLSASPGTFSFEQFLENVHPDDREFIRLEIGRARSGANELFVEFRVMNSDGSVRWISSRGYVEPHVGSSPAIIRGIVLDISSHKRAEEDLAHMRRDMEHMTRVSIMGELASALAHELNQPLAAILSNAQAGRRLLSTDPPNMKEINSIIEDIVADDKRAGEVIHRMRAMLHRGDHVQEMLDINTVVHDSIVLLNSELVGRRTRLILELGKNLPPFRGGKVEIQQVLINLVINGLDAMEDTSPDSRTITIATKENGENIEVAVKDSGTGISDELMASVFRPFYSSKPRGLGMGLAICRRIIEFHNGRLWAMNNPARGAAMVFSLPIARAKSANAMAASAQ